VSCRQRFIWAVADLHEPLHAIVEEQIATTQEAFCGASPEGLWGRAMTEEIDGWWLYGLVNHGEKRPGRPKCKRCLAETAECVDESRAGIRWAEKQP